MLRPDREFILAEIKRCAADNGGKPLGRARFEAATGIREADWLGRHWVRWGEVLVEAGFEPNTLQGRVHDDAGMAQHLAALTADLGRFPTRAEMRLRRKAEPAFPSDGSIEERFGPRAAVMAAVLSYAERTPGLEAVAAICRPLLDDGGSTTAPGGLQTVGFVYLARSGKHHKIGRSNDLGRRSYEIALQLPERLHLVHAIETDDPPGIEAYWHRRFESKRANGEWFLLSADDVAAFRARRRFM